MNIKKFENYKYPDFDSGDFDYPYGGHVFVLARPKEHWHPNDEYSKNEWIPCKISGFGDSQRIWIIGSSTAYNLKNWEIASPEEHKKWCENLILVSEKYQMIKDTRKYNL